MTIGIKRSIKRIFKVWDETIASIIVILKIKIIWLLLLRLCVKKQILFSTRLCLNSFHVYIHNYRLFSVELRKRDYCKHRM